LDFTAQRTPAPRVRLGGNADDVVFLDQGWSQDVREAYYQISQGSSVMPYDIFLNLNYDKAYHAV
jgi:hypothetical protein